jgi:hypothetical protein
MDENGFTTGVKAMCSLVGGLNADADEVNV